MLIVADSGPLIVFARGAHIELLRGIADAIIVPATVLRECTSDVRLPGAAAILVALRGGVLIERDDAAALGRLGALATLDAGETAAIALAIELRAPVLMDERLGRAVARHHQVPVIGSAGVLLRAKQLGRIDALRPILDAWRQDIGYFMSDALRAEVLRRAGETP